MKVELNYVSDLEFAEKNEPEGVPVISGIAFKTGFVSDRFVIIPDEEAKPIAETLKTGIDGKGAYIMKDHNHSIDSIIGRVFDSKSEGNLVYYAGRIYDEETLDKIKKELVTKVSIGLRAKELYCSICGKKYGTCEHRWGMEYPKETQHKDYQKYITDDTYKHTACIVFRDVQAVEVSLVSFPAIEDTSITQGISFSEELLKNLELESQDDLENNDDSDDDMLEDDVELDTTIEKLAEVLETFNNKNNDNIDSDESMSDTELETLREQFSQAETALAEKDATIAELNSQIENLTAELETTKSLLQKYQEEEARRIEEENKQVEAKIKSLTEELGLSVEYDFENMSLEAKKIVLQTLEASKVVAQGQVNDNDDGKLELERRKAELRKKIFGE